MELGQKEMTPCAMHEEMMQKKPISFGLDVNVHTGSCHGSQGYDGKKFMKELQTREEKVLQQRRSHWCVTVIKPSLTDILTMKESSVLTKNLSPHLAPSQAAHHSG